MVGNRVVTTEDVCWAMIVIMEGGGQYVAVTVEDGYWTAAVEDTCWVVVVVVENMRRTMVVAVEDQY